MRGQHCAVTIWNGNELQAAAISMWCDLVKDPIIRRCFKDVMRLQSHNVASFGPSLAATGQVQVTVVSPF